MDLLLPCLIVSHGNIVDFEGFQKKNSEKLNYIKRIISGCFEIILKLRGSVFFLRGSVGAAKCRLFFIHYMNVVATMGKGERER